MASPIWDGIAAAQENWHKNLRRIISLLESDRISSLTQVFSSNFLRRELGRSEQVGVGPGNVSIRAPWSFCPTIEHINVPSRPVRSISACSMVAENDHGAHWPYFLTAMVQRSESMDMKKWPGT